MTQKGRRNVDETLILALSCGSTIENAARQAGVVDRTVYRRLRDPEFQAKLRAARTDMVERTAAMLTAAAFESVKTLLKLQSDTHTKAVQLGAAKAVLEYGVKLRENSDLMIRVAAIEAQLTTPA
jgi:hypothetical protein